MTDLRFVSTEQPKMAAFNARFGKLNELYEYWWARRLPAGTRYVEKLTDVTDAEDFARDETVSYSPTISIDQSTGEISLVNASTLAVNNGNAHSGAAAQTLCDAAPCYVQTKYGLFYLPENADQGYQKTLYWGDYSTGDNDPIYGIIAYNKEDILKRYEAGGNNGVWARTVSAQLENIPAGEWEYVHSPDRSAYPDSGTDDDGTEWQFLGAPFENARGAVNVKFGSYIGTGTYGKSDPTSLTFDFAPRFIALFRYSGELALSTTVSTKAVGVTAPLTTEFQKSVCFVAYINSKYTYMKKSEDGKTLTWYSEYNASYQWNSADTHYYLAIG